MNLEEVSRLPIAWIPPPSDFQLVRSELSHHHRLLLIQHNEFFSPVDHVFIRLVCKYPPISPINDCMQYNGNATGAVALTEQETGFEN